MSDDEKDLDPKIVRDPVRKEIGQIEPDKAVYPQIRPEPTPVAEADE